MRTLKNGITSKFFKELFQLVSQMTYVNYRVRSVFL